MKLPVIDLFSGAGGMSCGFYQHSAFQLLAAVDAQMAKPSSVVGSLGCNNTYSSNLSLVPTALDLRSVSAEEIAQHFQLDSNFNGVLSACPPCTDFSRANPLNHGRDGLRNSLTSMLSDLLAVVRPRYFVYENAREALHGNHAHHLQLVIATLQKLRYSVWVQAVDFQNFGLPQRRERTLLVASRTGAVRSLHDLWRGYALDRSPSVGAALERLRSLASNLESAIDMRFPSMTPNVLARLDAIPRNGGSWTDIPDAQSSLLIPSMIAKKANGNTGSYRDVYGRVKLDRVAPTIKRECGHVGNGRYVHPFENRLMSVGEMAFLQGFPFRYRFVASSLSNCYRQIGDAVPPLLSFQLANLVHWMESGQRPTKASLALPESAFAPSSVSDEYASNAA